jgi:DNA-binding transcriptional LysR family regulator
MDAIPSHCRHSHSDSSPSQRPAFAAHGREHRVTFTSQSVMALQAAVENGLGVGVLPPEAIRPNTMRILKASGGMPEPLAVQYGLYAPDRRTRVVDAAIDALRQVIPAAATR